MFKKLIVLGALLLATPVAAQTCPTRPVGDNSNACASTAFVNQNPLIGLTLGPHLSLGGTTLSTDALGTGILATRGDIPTALPPNGSAGGDLSGTYPNPTVAKVQGLTYKPVAYLNGQIPTWVAANSDFEPGANSGSSTAPLSAGGRLTLTSSTPVMVSAVANATTLYYAPYSGSYVPAYDGSTVAGRQFTSSLTDTVGLSLALGANWAANSLYDVFFNYNAGSPVLCTSPAWTSWTAQAEPTTIYSGFEVNSASMTCRNSNSTTLTCAQYQCTYLGTILTDASNAGQITWTPGSTAAGGGAARLSIWNAANRVNTSATVANSTATWTYSSATGRQAGGSTTNNATFVSGRQVDAFTAQYHVTAAEVVANAYTQIGPGVDSATTLVVDAYLSAPTTATYATRLDAQHTYSPVYGGHVVYAVESGDGTNTTTFHGGVGTLGSFAAFLGFSFLM